MKKQSTLDFLARKLGEWPRRLGGAPVIAGYTWCKSSLGLFLHDDKDHDCTLIDAKLKITKEEWFLAQMETINTGVAKHKMEELIAAKDVLTAFGYIYKNGQWSNPHVI